MIGTHRRALHLSVDEQGRERFDAERPCVWILPPAWKTRAGNRERVSHRESAFPTPVWTAQSAAHRNHTHHRRCRAIYAVSSGVSFQCRRGVRGMPGVRGLHFYGQYWDREDARGALGGALSYLYPLYSGKPLLDLEVGFPFGDEVTLSVGAQNIFNTYPDENQGVLTGNGNLYGQFSPFGFNGGYYYVRINYGWGRRRFHLAVRDRFWLPGRSRSSGRGRPGAAPLPREHCGALPSATKHPSDSLYRPCRSRAGAERRQRPGSNLRHRQRHDRPHSARRDRGSAEPGSRRSGSVHLHRRCRRTQGVLPAGLAARRMADACPQQSASEREIDSENAESRRWPPPPLALLPYRVTRCSRWFQADHARPRTRGTSGLIARTIKVARTLAASVVQ